jgi:hypothetical protein
MKERKKGIEIFNKDNYNKLCAQDCLFYSRKYVELMNNFLIYGGENFHIQNKQYLCFVVKRGIETFSHVFKLLLLYTKNIELTSYHCKKAFFYYIEFIGQIGDDTHSYLQLNSKDAALFVYKKTIFEIDNDYKKAFVEVENEILLFNFLSFVMELYNKFVLFLIMQNDNSLEDKEFFFSDIANNTKHLFEHLLKKKIYNNLENTIYFLNILKTKDIEITKFKMLMNKFVKKISKKKITQKKIREKMFSKNIDLYLKYYSPLRLINYLFV